LPIFIQTKKKEKMETKTIGVGEFVALLDEVAKNHTLLCCVCMKPATSRCSACKSAWYCSRECQVLHYPKHKKLCGSVEFTGVKHMVEGKLVDVPDTEEGLIEVKDEMHSETINVANLGIVIKGVTDAAGAVERAHRPSKEPMEPSADSSLFVHKMVMKNPAEQKLEELFGPGSEKEEGETRIEGVAEVNDALLAINDPDNLLGQVNDISGKLNDGTIEFGTALNVLSPVADVIDTVLAADRVPQVFSPALAGLRSNGKYTSALPPAQQPHQTWGELIKSYVDWFVEMSKHVISYFNSFVRSFTTAIIGIKARLCNTITTITNVFYDIVESAMESKAVEEQRDAMKVTGVDAETLSPLLRYESVQDILINIGNKILRLVFFAISFATDIPRLVFGYARRQMKGKVEDQLTTALSGVVEFFYEGFKSVTEMISTITVATKDAIPPSITKAFAWITNNMSRMGVSSSGISTLFETSIDYVRRAFAWVTEFTKKGTDYFFTVVMSLFDRFHDWTNKALKKMLPEWVTMSDTEGVITKIVDSFQGDIETVKKVIAIIDTPKGKDAGLDSKNLRQHCDTLQQKYTALKEGMAQHPTMLVKPEFDNPMKMASDLWDGSQAVADVFLLKHGNLPPRHENATKMYQYYYSRASTDIFGNAIEVRPSGGKAKDEIEQAFLNIDGIEEVETSLLECAKDIDDAMRVSRPIRTTVTPSIKPTIVELPFVGNDFPWLEKEDRDGPHHKIYDLVRAAITPVTKPRTTDEEVTKYISTGIKKLLGEDQMHPENPPKSYEPMADLLKQMLIGNLTNFPTTEGYESFVNLFDGSPSDMLVKLENINDITCVMAICYYAILDAEPSGKKFIDDRKEDSGIRGFRWLKENVLKAFDVLINESSETLKRQFSSGKQTGQQGTEVVVSQKDSAEQIILTHKVTFNDTITKFMEECYGKSEMKELTEEIKDVSQSFWIVITHAYEYTQKIICSATLSAFLRILPLVVSVGVQLLGEYANGKTYKEDLGRSPSEEVREKYVRDTLNIKLELIKGSKSTEWVKSDLEEVARATAAWKIAKIRSSGTEAEYADISSAYDRRIKAISAIKLKLESHKQNVFVTSLSGEMRRKVNEVEKALPVLVDLDAEFLKYIESNVKLGSDAMAFFSSKLQNLIGYGKDKPSLSVGDLKKIGEDLAKSNAVRSIDLFDIIPPEGFFDMNELAKKTLKDYTMEIVWDTLSQLLGVSVFSVIREVIIACIALWKVSNSVIEAMKNGGDAKKFEEAWLNALTAYIKEWGTNHIVSSFMITLSHWFFFKMILNEDLTSTYSGWNALWYSLVNSGIVAGIFLRKYRKRREQLIKIKKT